MHVARAGLSRSSNENNVIIMLTSYMYLDLLPTIFKWKGLYKSVQGTIYMRERVGVHVHMHACVRVYGSVCVCV